LITLSQPLAFPKYQGRSGPDTGAGERGFASRKVSR
jgi:hypothetical protein